MPDEPQIRPATVHDVAALTRLRLALLREAGAVAEGSDVQPLAGAIDRYLRSRMAFGEFLAWVAEANGEVVAASGLVFFERPPDPGNLAGLEAYVMNMYVEPAWRGRRLATALMQAIIAHVQGTRARRIWLHATEAGRPTYLTLGFQPTSTDMELRW